MTEMERMIWCAAFATAWRWEKDLKERTPGSYEVSGFTCAEYADEALESYRDAIGGPNREYLTPVEEGWQGV